MSDTTTPSALIFTTHARQRMAERGLSERDVHDAIDDAVACYRQAGGHLEFRAENGMTVITDLTGSVVVTVLPPGARTALRSRRNSGVSRHRPDRRGPKNRDDRLQRR